MPAPRAHVAAAAVVQIVEDAMHRRIGGTARVEARLNVEDYLQNEFDDVERQARGDRYLAG